MRVATLEIKFYAPWVHSLKEKRMVVKSLTSKIRNKFNVSVCEVDEQDTLQTAVIGIAAIAANSSQADSIIDTILAYIETATEAEIVSADRDY
jgi:uncharacterized protein